MALVARAGTGKSLLLLALAVAITRGDRAFAGLRISTRRVFLVDMENTQNDIIERLRDLGVTPENAARLDNLVYLHLPLLPRSTHRQAARCCWPLSTPTASELVTL